MEAWAAANLPAGVAGALTGSVEGAAALERLMDAGEPGLGGHGGERPGGAVTLDGLRRLQGDPRYWRDRDPALDLRARTDERERLRRRRLKQALARARARFGAAGTGSAGGSAAALLGGLAAESEREGSYAGNAASRRLAALRADRAHAGRLDRPGPPRPAGGGGGARPPGRRG